MPPVNRIASLNGFGCRSSTVRLMSTLLVVAYGDAFVIAEPRPVEELPCLDPLGGRLLEDGEHGTGDDVRSGALLRGNQLTEPRRIGDFVVVDEDDEVALGRLAHGPVARERDPALRFDRVDDRPRELGRGDD